MQRRNFIKGTAAAAILGTGGYKTLAKGIIQESKKKDLLIPARLKPGDTIGLVAPGSFITENELKESVQNLEELGFKVAYSKNILARSGYLGGTDKQRADDVNNMFERKDINGIFCARGGYGCARILPILDYGKIEKNPKVIIGYSDITALLYGIYSQTGLVCYHGPVGISTFNEFSVYNMENVLMQPSASFAMISKPDKEDDELYKIYPIRSGIAKGELVGGNLSIVVSLIGTKYDIDTTGKIVFLEDVGEEPYRIDRMLTQMIEAGKFDNAEKIRRIKTPFLLLHGEQDDFVRFRDNGKVIYDNAPQPKSLKLVPGAKHNDIPEKMGNDKYKKLIKDWIHFSVKYRMGK